MDGAESISKERRRQVEKEGYAAEHDDEHDEGELALAAVCYASPQRIYILDERARAFMFIDPWPWDAQWDKRYTYESGNTLPEPGKYTRKERIKFLVKAGALLAAEIDRLQRIKA